MARATIGTPSWKVALLALAIVAVIAGVGLAAGWLLVVVDRALDPAALQQPSPIPFASRHQSLSVPLRDSCRDAS